MSGSPAVNLKSLKIFCDIVARRSFSRAAEDNGISQSGASQVVGQLENHLGVQLIERSKRPLVPTREGQAFYEGCRQLLAQYEALEDEIRALHEDVAGCVRVAAIYSVGLHHMSRYVQEFRGQHPKANVRLEYLHPERVLETVENGECDLGIVSYPRSTRLVEAEPWREEQLVIACTPDCPLAASDEAPLSALASRPMVAFDADLVIRQEIDRVLDTHDVSPEIVMEFDNIETIKRALEINACFAILPEPTVLREVAAGTLARVRIAEPDAARMVRPLGIIRGRNRPLAPTAQRFLDLLRGHAADQEVSPAATAAAR
ncbi:MAG: LysR family transcriptional regulator [Planctomycetes bacterium]|nr:LysR family transcriptional regulator [Planctomycetota bacterium]